MLIKQLFVILSHTMEKMVTTEIAAKLLNVTPARVRQLISENRLKSQKNGRDHFIDILDIKKFSKYEQKKAGRPKKFLK